MIALSPVFLFVSIMKKPLYYLYVFILSISIGWASGTIEAENMMRGLNNIDIPVNHEQASVQPGLSFGQEQGLFSLAVLNIPFGGLYYLNGGLGAGVDVNKEGELTLFKLGLGLYDNFEKSEDLFYSIGISMRTFQSLAYNTTILSGEFQLEQLIQNIRLGIGVLVGIQDYMISDSGYFPQAEERIYVTSFSVSARSPYGNVSVNGTPNSLRLGLSWTFKLEDIK
jgi:hypothetical protein